MINWNVNYVYEEVKDSNSNVMSVTWVIEHINNSILITKARLVSYGFVEDSQSVLIC